ncbi:MULTISPECIES: GGDEF domain-containing protein [unclassified Oleiphilus]|jgi:diguanylate cyclase (GGDEF)-like protein|uniref:GGDEF domain-containing protein n=5 Tax=Oleiphilus TaxID=141450 RepID=UPI0007C27245|nr:MULTISPECIES: GGDEF domain-containing protein [unclassified Oleiphilus]KZY77571.1 hypothetical protein A3741_09335 [Oleiphilus sp. HI0069]KZY94075.1 hypothetical protein A3743_05990 [Oleiphilus sp. HI0072]KZZ11766.1 hypothetical protein A3749_08230 [Oleiphilus sp. HI0078]KZZ27360.1 hypothetical protein A3752_22860 [Oleiphilus sp. HI0081]KZZ33109.1 hypothetical protein A3755_01140 [Oleiphilus sp. HI0085]
MVVSSICDRPSIMEIEQLFTLIKSLTSQSNIRELVTALDDILINNFERVDLSVYELQATRRSNHKTTTLIGIECSGKSNDIYLNNDMDMLSAYISKEEVYKVESRTRFKIVIPVVLYDKSVSHLVVLRHRYENQDIKNTLVGFLQIAVDIFRNLHEKGHDPLTRILNRQAFDQVSSDLAFSQHNVLHAKDTSFKAIAILDIDKFKSINDRFGHAIGDETLVLFSQTVRSVLRQQDLFFRYGGEEFVVLVKDVQKEQALVVLERCRAAIEARRFPQVGQVTVSIGFADLSKNDHPVETLSKADKALYYAKQNGRNQVNSYEVLLEKGLLEAVEPVESSIDFWD